MNTKFPPLSSPSLLHVIPQWHQLQKVKASNQTGKWERIALRVKHLSDLELNSSSVCYAFSRPGKWTLLNMRSCDESLAWYEFSTKESKTISGNYYIRHWNLMTLFKWYSILKGYWRSELNSPICKCRDKLTMSFNDLLKAIVSFYET